MLKSERVSFDFTVVAVKVNHDLAFKYGGGLPPVRFASLNS